MDVNKYIYIRLRSTDRPIDPRYPYPPTTPTTPDRRKKEAREAHRRSKFAQKVHGLRAKLYNAKRYKEKAQMRKT